MDCSFTLLVKLLISWRHFCLVVILFLLLVPMGVIKTIAQERCGTVAYTQLLQQENLLREHENKFEQWIGRKVVNLKDRTGARAVYKIPVVFHIVHNGEAVGNGTNLSEAQILSQLKVLNNDFRRLNSDTAKTPAEFLAFAGRINIEFVLAKQSPTGTSTNGIIRVKGNKSQWSLSDNRNLKAHSYWPAEDYLNIWITDLASTVLGYAQFPVSNLPGLEDAETNRLTDGVVLDYRIIGSNQDGSFNLTSNFNRGRTATHEVGHFFGLRHIWGDDEGACSGSGDYVEDTPDQGNSSNGCPSHPSISCNGRTMFQNYMDYTNDVCMNLYTKQQVERMLVVLENSPRRTSLLTSKGLYDPAPATNDLAILNIASPRLQECIGSIIPKATIKNNGANRVTAVKINLTINNIVVESKEEIISLEPLEEIEISFGSYPLATGTFTFHFEIVQTNLSEDGKSNDNSKTVETKVPHQIATPFAEIFGSLPSTWELTSKGETNWNIASTGGSGSSNNALQIKFFQSSDDTDEADVITTPIIDLSQATSPFLAFDVAYGKFQNHADGLEVYVVTDCSKDLAAGNLIYSRYGNDLATVSATTNSFSPVNENQWRHEVIDLHEFIGIPNVQIAFVAVNDNGNNLYLDNIALRTDVFDNVAIKRLVSPGPVQCSNSITPVLLVANDGNSTVQNFVVRYSANGGDLEQFTYRNLNLEAGQDTTLTLPVVSLQDGSNKVLFRVLYPNGFHDIDSTDNSMVVKSIVNNDQDRVPLRVNFDGSGEEIAWQSINPLGNSNWQIAPTNYDQSFYFSGSDTVSRNYEEHAWFVSPLLDFSNAVTASMFFDVSYLFEGTDSSKDASDQIFQILASRDCGETFAETLFSSEEDFGLEGQRSSKSSPTTPEDWKTFYVNLNELAGQKDVRIAFVVSGSISKPVYLDNIEFFMSDDPSPDVISDLYVVYPNKIEEEKSFHLTFNLPSRQTVTYELIDALGKRVGSQALNDVLNQTYKVDVGNASSGIYLVRLLIDSKYYISRVVVSQ